MKISLTVPEGAASLRLDAWLAGSLDLPRTRTEKLIRSGKVTSERGAILKSTTIVPGDVYHVEIEEEVTAASPAAAFTIRYEDEHVAVVSKPPGVVVHPSRGHATGTLVQALAESMPLSKEAGLERPGVVHRLDKDTSGILLFAKTDIAYRGLKEAMQARLITRIYTALASGSFQMKLGRIEASLGRLPTDPTKVGVLTGGKGAITEFEVEERFIDCCLLNVRLLTGRTHQIRVHLAHIDHPVIGDRTYGPRTMVMAQRIGLERMFLHAGRLEFSHPVHGDKIEVEDPLHSDLADALDRIRAGDEGR